MALSRGGKDVVCRAEVEFENAEWRLVRHPPQRRGVIAVCMQSRCLALRSQLVHECQSWKGPVFRCLLSQLLASQVIAPSLAGQGLRGRARTSPQDLGLPVLGSPVPLRCLLVAVRLSLCV